MKTNVEKNDRSNVRFDDLHVHFHDGAAITDLYLNLLFAIAWMFPSKGGNCAIEFRVFLSLQQT